MDDIRFVWFKEMLMKNFDIKNGAMIEELLDEVVTETRIQNFLSGHSPGDADVATIAFYKETVEEEIEVEVPIQVDEMKETQVGEDDGEEEGSVVATMIVMEMIMVERVFLCDVMDLPKNFESKEFLFVVRTTQGLVVEPEIPLQTHHEIWMGGRGWGQTQSAAAERRVSIAQDQRRFLEICRTFVVQGNDINDLNHAWPEVGHVTPFWPSVS